MSLKAIRVANLRALAEKRGLAGPMELGRLIGRKPNQTSDLLNGRASFGEKVARAIETAANLPEGWLDRQAGATPVKVEDVEGSYRLPKQSRDLVIPQFATGGSMGRGLVLRDQPGSIQSWCVTSDWVAKNVHNFTSPANLAIVTGFGDSMRPLYNPGDPLLVDTGVTSVDFDGVYFFRVGEEGFVKRLQRIPGIGLRAISENKSYESWDIKESMDFQVFARVLKIWRSDDF